MRHRLTAHVLSFAIGISPAAARVADMVFICRDDQGRNVDYVTVSVDQRKVTMISGFAPARCVSTIKNGAVGRIMSAPAGESCPLLLFGDDGNQPVQQSVSVKGDEVEFSIKNGSSVSNESLNFDTGLLQTSAGIEECHRPHS